RRHAEFRLRRVRFDLYCYYVNKWRIHAMKIDVIGGGPSGLYFPLLIRRPRPDWRVRVLEQNERDATFGFGVVLADTGLQRLHEADAESHDRLGAAMGFSDPEGGTHR